MLDPPSVQLRWRNATHAALVSVLLWSAPASAQLGRALGEPLPDEPAIADATDPDWAFDLTATTSVPLAVGVEATLISPVGLYGYLSFGHTPQPYLGAIADALAGADVYGPTKRPLIDEMIADGAWVVRLGVGFTIPEGLELSVGYTLLTASPTLTPGTIEMATGQTIRWPGMTQIPVTMTAHAFHGRVGWRAVIEEHFLLRFALGWAHTLAADVGATVPDEVREHPSDPAGGFEADLADGFRSWGFTPELIVSAGYRF